MAVDLKRKPNQYDRLFSGVFSGKRVLVTGHTGFKGSWLSLWLTLLGADVVGYALPPATPDDVYVRANLDEKIESIYEDILDFQQLQWTFEHFEPEIVFHLAAQPNVRFSYVDPIHTFETNIMGTANVLEAFRLSPKAKVCIVVTSDKCYENTEQLWGYRESDPMGGIDPYSASKGCAELVTASYMRAFFDKDPNKWVATVRAGNVIGGGDWTQDRIVPDCIKSLREGKEIILRNPNAIRPWQFVLEPLYGYLSLASKMFLEGKTYAGGWNFGPNNASNVSVQRLVETLLQQWAPEGGKGLRVQSKRVQPHEASFLRLDCTKANHVLGWHPLLSFERSIKETLFWYQNFETMDGFQLCKKQIDAYSKRIQRAESREEKG